MTGEMMETSPLATYSNKTFLHVTSMEMTSTAMLTPPKTSLSSRAAPTVGVPLYALFLPVQRTFHDRILNCGSCCVHLPSDRSNHKPTLLSPKELEIQ